MTSRIARLQILVFCFGLASSNAQSAFKFIADPTIYGNAPDSLSKTGFYSDIVKKTVGAGIHAYDVNTPGWHSGAVSERFVTVPAGQKINFNNSQKFDFPQQTTFIQNLIYSKGSLKRYLETRIMVLKNDTWYVFAYRWNAAETDAKLAYDFDQKDTVFTFGADKLPWRYPSQDGCWKCHIKSTDQVLSFVPPQLNRTSVKTASLNQLTHFFQTGLLGGTLPNVNTLFSWAAIDNNGAGLEHRARSYLAANCAGCHSVETSPFFTGSPVYGIQDLSYWSATMPMNYKNLAPDKNGIYSKATHLRVYHQASPDSSLALIRMRDMSMPFGGFVTTPDSQGISLLKQWISGWPASISGRKAGPQHNKIIISGNKLYLSGSRERISFFDLHGKEIKLVSAGSGEYLAPAPFVAGIYIVKSAGREALIEAITFQP